MIVDHLKVYFKAGRGGRGGSAISHISHHKERGDGGDGGEGGNVYLKVDAHYYDLKKFKSKNRFEAPDGEAGRAANRKGRDAEDLEVGIPPGTRVLTLNGKILADLTGTDESFLICRGGRGGKGNYKRDYTKPAGRGEEKEVFLDYRIPNDIAILGFPNTGKTSLFNALTGHDFKVAAYPFTTLSCITSKFTYNFRDYIVLDTPPLKRKGISCDSHNRFLRHIARSKILLFLSRADSDFESDFEAIKKGITGFSPGLLKNKKVFYLVNKIDKMDKIPVKRGIFFISVQASLELKELKIEIERCLTASCG
ncbi:MAG: hypothetical protein GF375_01085 [Candidatus Omnitrophica bacterium]|nr:hypothetical protein [Candidatus Omnitrophota bacterium]MBD3268730.1 hypothetical protein [Candidatus Omnitrophota bacterium]